MGNMHLRSVLLPLRKAWKAELRACLPVMQGADLLLTQYA